MKRTAQQTRNLLKLVDLMEYDPDPENFDMECYFSYPCGTPACLVGHYAHSKGENTIYAMRLHRTSLGEREFGLNNKELDYIFSDERLHGSGKPEYRGSDTQAIAASRVIDVLYGGVMA